MTDAGTILQEIDDTVNVMHDNIQKVRERGENLDHLQTKTDNLANQAHGFRRGANRVRKQMWWKDMKMRMCLIAGVIILLLIIIVPSMWNKISPAGWKSLSDDVILLTFFFLSQSWSPKPNKWLTDVGDARHRGAATE